MTDQTSSRQNLPEVRPSDAFVRQRARQAADAAQHVIDMESALQAAMRENAELASRLSVTEESCKILHEQVAALTEKSERLQHRNSVIMDRLRSAGSLILNLMKDPEDPYAPNAAAARLAEIANEQPKRIEPMTADEGDEARRLGSMFAPPRIPAGEER